MLRLDFNLVWNIVNVIVLYLLLKHFLIKPVMDIMNKRQAMVDQSITNARASESQASELKSRYEEKLAASAEEGKKLVEEAKAEAKTVQERMIKEAGEQADRIIENAHKTANADQEKAMREAEAQIAGLPGKGNCRPIPPVVSSLYGRVARYKNQALYDQYIAEAGDSHDAGSK